MCFTRYFEYFQNFLATICVLFYNQTAFSIQLYTYLYIYTYIIFNIPERNTAAIPFRKEGGARQQVQTCSRWLQQCAPFG